MAIPILFAGKTENVKSRWKTTGLFLLVFSLFPVSWTIRNTIAVESDSLKGGARAITTISHGAYPGFVFKDPKFKYYPYREDPMQPAFGSSFENFRKILWERFKQKPVRYLTWYLFEKPYYIWSWDNLQSQGQKRGKGTGDIYIYPVRNSLYYTSNAANILRLSMKILHPAILISALAGILLFIVSRQLTLGTPLLIVIVYYTLLYTVFAPWPRYSVPLRPELYLFAIYS
ncbi:MAG: hypothetical protein GY757_32585, partial [bacterium]|nr:hypothetical protein [bacterium]